MTFKDKRQAKKLAKVWFTIAWSMVTLFILFVVTLIVLLVSDNFGDTEGTLLNMTIFFSPIFIGMFSGMIGQVYVDKRVDYKRKIKKYRMYRFFIKTLDNLWMGDISAAIDSYNMIPTRTDERVFLNGYLICSALSCDDPERQETAKKRLDKIRLDYLPENVQF